MSMFTSLSRQASRLSAGLQGEVVLPGQPRFDQARRAFNLAADQEPAAVVFAESAHDRSEERRVGKECRSRWSPYH